MRSTIALTVAVAAAAVSAQNCNPSYNVPGSTKCFTDCNVSAGNTFMSGWTMDHTSPKFLESLKLMCTKGTPQYTAFMTKAGMCMAGCAGDDPELFNAEFAGACGWYATHKDDKCDEGTAATTTAPAATTTTAPAATTTAATGNTAAPVASSAASGASSAVAAASSGVSSVAAAASSAINSAVKPNASPSPSAATQPNAANKLQLSGYAMALVAGAGYLAL